MDSTTILNLISRWFHIIPAIVMVGGTIFLRLALLPAFNDLAEGEHAALRESMRRKWMKWIGICTLLLLVSGFYNAYFKIVTYELSSLYSGLLLVKIVLAFAVFYLTASLSGRSKTAVKLRERELHWTNVLCGLMLSIVLIAGAMKIFSTGAELKQKPADVIVSPQQDLDLRHLL